MYLSRLVLNMALPETRRLLLSPYMLHKAVFRGFPDVGEGGPGRILYVWTKRQIVTMKVAICWYNRKRSLAGRKPNC